MEFRYRTADATGRIETGTARAESKEQLIQKLRIEGRYLLEIREQSAPDAKFRIRRFKPQDRLSFTQQLTGLLNAGITLERALAILSELQLGEKLEDVIRQLRRSLEAGLSFTAALEKFPEYFPPLFINMVRAGEAGGILPRVLERLTRYQEDELRLRRFISSSLVYPAFVLAASILALIFFVTVVIPSFQQIFESMGAELPFLTRMVLFCGRLFLRFWWVLLLIVTGAVLGLLKFITTPEGRLRFDRFKLHLPLLGVVFQKIATARMALALSQLVMSGVPLLHSIEIASDVAGNEFLGRALREAGTKVRQGNTFAGSLAGQGAFPVLAVKMIGVGEESGSLGPMLERVSRAYDGEVQHSMGIFLSVFEPLLIVLLVGVIAILAVSVLTPILNINSQISPMG